MSIISVEEQYGGRSGSIDGKRQRNFTRVFSVETSSPYVGPYAVRTASGIPLVGSAYNNGLSIGDPLREFDNGAFVSSIRADEESDGAGVAWKVTVEYSPFDWSEFGPDPTLWKIRVTFSGERTERVVDFDKDGTPIRNSATDKFGDPVTVDDHITTLTITRNEKVSTFDIEKASQYSDTVNDATWNGVAARYAKMGIISTSEEQYDSNGHLWYYKVTYPVSIGRKPWQKELLDQGYNELDGAYPAKPKPIMNAGQPIADPVALDGAGHRLATDGTPVTLTFFPFDEADWSALSLDLSTRLGL